MSSVDDAFSIAQSLTPAEQFQLIARLWETMPREEFKPSDSDLAEVKRRWAEYEAGRMEAISWEEVWAEIESELDGDD
jgi:putative addiction module component (TIGR02574 family)